jgi:hypothetical protein
MSSERTLASTFFAAFRLSSAESRVKCNFFFLAAGNGYSAQSTENGCLFPSPVTSDTSADLSALNGLTIWSPNFGITAPISYSIDVILFVEVSLK